MKSLLLLPLLAATVGLSSAQCDVVNEDFESYANNGTQEVNSLPGWLSTVPSRATVRLGSGSNTSNVMLIGTLNGGISVQRTVTSPSPNQVDLSVDMKVSGQGQIQIGSIQGLPLATINFDNINSEVTLQGSTNIIPLNPDFATITIQGAAGGTLTVGYDGQVVGTKTWPVSAGSVEKILFHAVGAFNLITNLEIDNICMNSSQIGTTYCTTGQNSTGQLGNITAFGSAVAANNDVTLRMDTLPVNQFGYFLLGDTQGDIAVGQSSSLCVLGAGGRLGRLNRTASEILYSGSAGMAELKLDLTNIPLSPTTISVMAGETYNFQGWHRENGGQSNFTSAVSITFQ